MLHEKEDQAYMNIFTMHFTQLEGTSAERVSAVMVA